MVIMDVQGAGAALIPATVTIIALMVLVAPGVIARFGAEAPAAFPGLGGLDRGAYAPPPTARAARLQTANRDGHDSGGLAAPVRSVFQRAWRRRWTRQAWSMSAGSWPGWRTASLPPTAGVRR
jgi:hypothetical protein